MKILSVLRPGRTESDIDSIGAMSLAVNLAKELSDKDIRTDFMTDAKIQGYISYPSNGEKASANTVRAFSLYRNFHYDILHIHIFTYSTIQAIVDNIEPTDRVVVTLHLSPEVGRSSFVYKDAIREMAMLPNISVVCVSEQGILNPLLHMLDLPNADSLNTVVIYNGIKESGLSYVPVAERYNSCCLIGRMEISKNILEALTFCVENNRKIFYIGRESETKSKSAQEYVQRVREYIANHPELITHYEKLPNYKVRELLGLCKFNISFSVLEGCALTPVEACFEGTPNLYLDTPGLRDTMSTTTCSMMIPPDQIYRKTWRSRYPIVEKVAQELCSTYTDELRQSMAKTMKDAFSLRVCADNYLSLYERMVKSK